MLSVFVVPISISGTAIALPSIANDLGASPIALQWVVNGFNVSFALATVVWGVLSDRFGAKPTFILGAIIVLAASFVSALAPSLIVLDIGRALAGIGGAAIITGASSILSNAFEGSARGRAFALFGTTIGLGVALGPSLAGALIAAIGWQGVYYAFAVVMVLTLVGSTAVPRIAHERAPEQKSIDFSLLRNKRFLAFSLVPVAAAIGFVTIISYFPVALSAVAGLSAGAAGLFMLPMTIPVLLGPVIAAQLVRRVAWITPMTMMYVALAALFLGDLGLLLLSPGIALGWLVLPMVLLGFGFGFPIGLVDGEALAAVPARSSGTAAGVLGFLRLGSEAVAVGAYAAILATLIADRLNDPRLGSLVAAGQTGQGAVYAESFHWVVLGMAVLMVIATITITALYRASVREAPIPPTGETADPGLSLPLG